MLRRLSADFKDYPATMGFCVAWLVVFVGMLLSRALQDQQAPWSDLIISIGGGHRFGDMTLTELFRGELWRPLTSTFVHYGILHFAMNAFGMYQLGALVESWYGSAQFVAIYVLIGAGGNLISGLIRRELGSNPAIHSGGGSTVVLGLVALCAVVGWKSKSRVGDYLRGQMVTVLVFTALLGAMLPIIDNWGHAGGALMGAAIGLAHGRLRQSAGRPIAKVAGFLGLACLIAAASAQYRFDHNEAPARRLAVLRERYLTSDRAFKALIQVAQLHRFAAMPRPIRPGSFVPRQARFALPNAMLLLDKEKPDLDRRPNTVDYRRLRDLLALAIRRPATADEYVEFQRRLAQVIRRVLQERNTAQGELVAVQRPQAPRGVVAPLPTKAPAPKPNGARAENR